MKFFAVLPFVVAALTVSSAGAEADADPALRDAKRLALSGLTDEAITEYKRYLFFNPDSGTCAVYHSIAGLYRDAGRFADAREALTSALASAGSDSLRDAIRIELSMISLAQGERSSAQMELLRIASFAKTRESRDRAGFLLCMVDISNGELDEAEKISSAGAASGDRRLGQVDSLLKNAPRWVRKSPRTAKILSTVLPGLGQVYARDLPGGLNALAISAVTGFMTVNSLFYGYYQEAIFTDLWLFWRYYSGNRWNAATAAERYNAKRDRLFFNLVIDKNLPRRYLK
jgi:hypothetical protein